MLVTTNVISDRHNRKNEEERACSPCFYTGTPLTELLGSSGSTPTSAPFSGYLFNAIANTVAMTPMSAIQTVVALQPGTYRGASLAGHRKTP